MQITVSNGYIEITKPTQQLENAIREELTYKDKTKQYQLRRLGKTAWGRNSPLYKQLQQEVDGKLYTEINGNFAISSCFYKHFESMFSGASIIDNRKETGKKIVVPWVKKPHALRPYQEEAVDLMLTNYRGVINFATGLGKTLVATHLVQRYKRATLVVCPSDSVASNSTANSLSALGKQKLGFTEEAKRISGILQLVSLLVSLNMLENSRPQILEWLSSMKLITLQPQLFSISQKAYVKSVRSLASRLRIIAAMAKT
jgi:hypothetical protein